jgi:hypothetical protein
MVGTGLMNCLSWRKKSVRMMDLNRILIANLRKRGTVLVRTWIGPRVRRVSMYPKEQIADNVEMKGAQFRIWVCLSSNETDVSTGQV